MNDLSSKRILHREKPDGLTVEFVLGKCDLLIALAEDQLPFDDPGASKGWLKRCLENNELQSVLVRVDGKDVGMIAFAVVPEAGGERKELLVSSAVCVPGPFSFLPLMRTCALKIAKDFGCDFLRFHTVRKGLIREAIKLGFYVSEIVMREKIV